jgi:hypothetical protein
MERRIQKRKGGEEHMKNIFVAMLALVIGLAFGTVTFAADPAPGSSTMTEKKEEKKEEKKNGDKMEKMEKKTEKKETKKKK